MRSDEPHIDQSVYRAVDNVLEKFLKGDHHGHDDNEEGAAEPLVPQLRDVPPTPRGVEWGHPADRGREVPEVRRQADRASAQVAR